MLAGSTGRRNTGVKFLCRGFKSQGLAWPLIELAGHFVEMGLRVHRQVGSFRKILSQQAIGVLVGTPPPSTLPIAKPNSQPRPNLLPIPPAPPLATAPPSHRTTAATPNLPHPP